MIDRSQPSDQNTAAPRPEVRIGEARIATFGNHLPFALVAGPCALESQAHAFDIAAALRDIAEEAGVGLVFKTSFDKANRTAADSGRGLGLDAALAVFADIRSKLGLPVTTDVHETWQCAEVAPCVDLLQIPAFLCRQTDLLLAAGATGRAVNVKKGQFLAPWDLHHAVDKIRGTGNARILVTERGASFGYNALVSDMRALPILAETCATPVLFDATHSVQQPGGQGARSGGERRFVNVLARAAAAVGVAGLFIEAHDNPERAISDAETMISLTELKHLLSDLREFDAVAKRSFRQDIL